MARLARAALPRVWEKISCSTLTAGKRPAWSWLRRGEAGLIWRRIMSYEALEKEIALYEKRTPKSAAAHKRARATHSARRGQQLPALRAVSDFCEGRQRQQDSRYRRQRIYRPQLCFGALMAGHCHPAVVKAVKRSCTKARRSACRTSRNGNWRKKSARAIRWKWCGSARAAPK